MSIVLPAKKMRSLGGRLKIGHVMTCSSLGRKLHVLGGGGAGGGGYGSPIPPVAPPLHVFDVPLSFICRVVRIL